MAITFDTSATASGTLGNGSLSITPTSGATLLIVSIASQTAVSGVTYGSQSMTQFDTVRNNLYSFYLVNPSIGTNTVTATKGGGFWSLCAATWKDVNQTSTPNSTGGNDGGSNSITVSTTTTVDNCMLIWTGGNNNGGVGITSSTGSSVRRAHISDSVSCGIFDLLVAQTPAGSKSVNLTSSGAFVSGSILSIVQGAVANTNSNFLALF